MTNRRILIMHRRVIALLVALAGAAAARADNRHQADRVQRRLDESRRACSFRFRTLRQATGRAARLTNTVRPVRWLDPKPRNWRSSATSSFRPICTAKASCRRPRWMRRRSSGSPAEIATLVRNRMAAARDALERVSQVDPKRVAAVGYGVGGTAVLELARNKADLDGVVCVHGDLTPTGADGKNVSASLLIISGPTIR